jgi:DNA-directed RNA polymerase specialized sigma24 family protein
VRGILAFEDDDTLPRVQDFLNGLDERHAKATIMRMEFYTMEEVGTALGTSRQRVHQLINKVREEYLFYEVHGRHRKRGEKI